MREGDARQFHEGAELCRDYLREARLWFGTSTLLPGEEGTMDPGHAKSVEVFYCAQGAVAISDGERTYELGRGDALVIPEGMPHALRNTGTTPALVVWAGAPGE